MNIKKTILLLIILLLVLIKNNSIAANDTTFTKEFKRLPDTTQIRILVEYSDECEISDILTYTDRAIELGEKIKNQNLGYEFLRYYAAAYNNEAYYFDQVGNIKESLKSNIRALSLREEINDSVGIGESYNNLAYLFQQQGDFSSATNYYNKASKIFVDLKDQSGLVSININLGYVYFLEQKYDSSQVYFETGLVIAEEVNDVKGTSYALNNLASIYLRKELYDKAEEAYLKSLELRQQIGSKDGVARSHHNLGRFYFKREDLKKSFYHANICYQLANELNSPDVIGQATELLSDLYFKKNNFKKAFEFLRIHVEMKDSILSDETQQIAVKQQAKYEYEKQKAIDDKEHEKQLAISAEQEKKQRVIIYSIAGGLCLVVLFSILIYNRLQVTRKQKLIIEEQKQEAEQQKEIIEEAHKEITDSITYAKRIQEAILPPDRLVQKWLTNSFIIYKPKDIVAGDFYWMEQIDDKILFAAADCTGHGVPGAMVSVVCHNAMNRAVREFKLINPNEILDKTRELVVEQFIKSDKDVKDGMDIALCVLNNKTKQLQYSGANNPLWILRNEAEEIEEIKATKQSIGKVDSPQPFKTHHIQLNKKDVVYIFSDGYADQFGGEKGKKLKYKPFKKLLISLRKETMEKQREIINNHFLTWKGELEQVDDICIVGVKI
jgi:serine phosphatase RsbU (regulator of sigma subunit)